MGSILPIGGEFAGYRVDALIGQGGMSEVYRAENPRLERKVAIKILSAELAENQLFRERFIRESRMAASLDHPHVLPIYDAGEANGLPYIVMRYIEGSDLKELVEREGRLSLQRAMTIVEQIGGALDAAHAKGLVHRDVKPANILVEPGRNGAADHAYLSDFGVAKHNLTASGLTHTGHFVGTIDYVAPEQIEGKELDGRTDVYSLGCVLYEALTAVPPFDRDSNVAMIYAHLLDPPPALGDRRPDLPVTVDAVIAKALAKAREERFESCGALAAELRGAAAPSAAAATRAAARPPLATKLSDTAGAAPVTVGRADGEARAAAVATEAAAPASSTTRRSETRGEADYRRRRLGRRPILIGIVVVALIAAAAAAAGTALMHSSGSKPDATPPANAASPNHSPDHGKPPPGTSKVDHAEQTTMVDVYGGPRKAKANRRKLTGRENRRVRALLRAGHVKAAKRYVQSALRRHARATQYQRYKQLQQQSRRRDGGSVYQKYKQLQQQSQSTGSSSSTYQKYKQLQQSQSTGSSSTYQKYKQLQQQSQSTGSGSSTYQKYKALQKKANP